MPVDFTVRAEDPSGFYDPAEETRRTEARPRLVILFPEHMYDGRPFDISVVASDTQQPLAGKRILLNGEYKGDTKADGKFTLTVGGT